jgi:integrase
MAIQTRVGKDGIRRYRARKMRDYHRHVGPWRDSKAHAAQDEADMLRAIAEGRWHLDYGPDRVPTFREVADDHLAEFARLVHEGKRSKRTLLDKRQRLQGHILPELGDRRIDQITQLDVERLKRRLRNAANLAGPTVNRYLAVTSSVFRAARGWCTNPVSGIERYEENHDRWTAITPEEAEELIAAAGRDSNSNMRVLLVLIWEAALRSKSEALRLRWEDVDWSWRDHRAAKRGLLRLRATKAGESQEVPLSKRLRGELQAWRRRTPGVWVFPGNGAKPMGEAVMYKAWKRITEAAGFPPTLRLHDFRHGRATDLMRRGAAQRHVQELLRHKTQAMTDRYVHMTINDAAAAIEAGEKVVVLEPKEKRRNAE